MVSHPSVLLLGAYTGVQWRDQGQVCCGGGWESLEAQDKFQPLEIIALIQSQSLTVF